MKKLNGLSCKIMKTFEFTEEQISMLKDACLCVVALMINGNEVDKKEAIKYRTLLNYIES